MIQIGEHAEPLESFTADSSTPVVLDNQSIAIAAEHNNRPEARKLEKQSGWKTSQFHPAKFVRYNKFSADV